MNLKTFLIVSVAIFYVFGISAFVFDCAALFAPLCALAAIVLTFLKLAEPKHAVILFLIFCAGFYNIKSHTKDYDTLFNTYINNIELFGRVESMVQTYKGGERAKFYLNVKSAKVYNKTYDLDNTKTLVTIDDFQKRFDKIQIGDTIKIVGNLRTPRKAQNPSQFDYAKYLKFKDTFSTLYSNGKRFEITAKADGYTNPEEFWYYILQKTDSARDKITDKHAKYVKSPYLEILGGIVFGNEAINPPDEIKQSFVNSGLLHLLAASGLNVALIFGIWWFLARNLRLPYRVSIYLGAFFIILYTFMTGFPPSILRAAIMLLFVLFGKLTDRLANPVALIFFVGFLMLLFEPKMFCDVGFQLSFIVTIGLIATIEPICTKFETANKKYVEKIKNLPRPVQIILLSFSPKIITATLLIPLCAQLYVAPLQMYYFNTFTPWSLLANLCVIPFIGIISFLGFTSSIFGAIPYLGDKIIAIFDIAINPLLVLLVNISRYFSDLKYSILTTPSPSALQMIIFWIILILIVSNISSNFKNKKGVIALTATVLILCATFIKFPHKDFEVLVFSVGNADSILITTPKQKHIMIDTAGAPYNEVSSAKMIMGEYLRDNNIRELEMLILTHFDTDHCGGTFDIIEDFRVKNVLVANLSPNEKSAQNIINALKNKKIAHKSAKNNETAYLENNFTLKTYLADTKDENENSIITLVESNDTKILFMGDSGVKGYSKLSNPPLKADIIKVGHHGAKSTLNDKMLNTLQPHSAIISSGFNAYGHPDFETLRLLDKHKVPAYVTKEVGAIKISECKNGTCTLKHYDTRFKEFKPL